MNNNIINKLEKDILKFSDMYERKELSDTMRIENDTKLEYAKEILKLIKEENNNTIKLLEENILKYKNNIKKEKDIINRTILQEKLNTYEEIYKMIGDLK